MEGRRGRVEGSGFGVRGSGFGVRLSLVPKLRLGNAHIARRRLERGRPQSQGWDGSQAGAWEPEEFRVQSFPRSKLRLALAVPLPGGGWNEEDHSRKDGTVPKLELGNRKRFRVQSFPRSQAPAERSLVPSPGGGWNEEDHSRKDGTVPQAGAWEPGGKVQGSVFPSFPSSGLGTLACATARRRLERGRPQSQGWDGSQAGAWEPGLVNGYPYSGPRGAPQVAPFRIRVPSVPRRGSEDSSGGTLCMKTGIRRIEARAIKSAPIWPQLITQWLAPSCSSPSRRRGKHHCPSPRGEPRRRPARVGPQLGFSSTSGGSSTVTPSANCSTGPRPLTRLIRAIVAGMPPRVRKWLDHPPPRK